MQAAKKVLHKLPALVIATATEADEVTLSFVHKLLAMNMDKDTVPASAGLATSLWNVILASLAILSGHMLHISGVQVTNSACVVHVSMIVWSTCLNVKAKIRVLGSQVCSQNDMTHC